MKRSAYARRAGVSYKTAWRWWRAGKLDAYQAASQVASGTISVRDIAHGQSAPSCPTGRRLCACLSGGESPEAGEPGRPTPGVVCRQGAAKGYQIHRVARENGSGLNDRRPQCLHLLADPLVRVIAVERQDCATRFGFRALETLLAQQGRHMEVVNLAENAREDNAREEGVADVEADLVAFVDSFCASPSGQRRASRAKRKTAAMVNALTDQEASQEASVAGEGEGEHASR